MDGDAALTALGRPARTWRVRAALFLLVFTAACQGVPLPPEVVEPPRDEPKGHIVGSVFDRDGQPALGVGIEVQPMPGNPHSVPAVGLNTDEGNTFEFLPLHPGRYRVTARSGEDVLAREVVRVEAGKTHKVVLRGPRQHREDEGG